MVYKLFDKQIRSGARTTSVNKVLAQKLHKPAIRKFKEEKCIQGLKVIFGQEI